PQIGGGVRLPGKHLLAAERSGWFDTVPIAGYEPKPPRCGTATLFVDQRFAFRSARPEQAVCRNGTDATGTRILSRESDARAGGRVCHAASRAESGHLQPVHDRALAPGNAGVRPVSHSVSRISGTGGRSSSGGGSTQR